MKKILIAITVLASFCSAQELGIILGEPTGISYRHVLGESTAMDFAAGWSFRSGRSDEYDNVDIHGAYLFHRKSDMRIEGYRLPFYFGPGARIKIGGDKVVLGVKAPFGAYYKFKNMPFSMFFELAPGLNLTPSTEFDIMGGLGFRYIFGGSGGSAADEPAGEDTRRERR
jgi:hypothetical protein